MLEVADLAKEFCDVGALGADLALGLGECLFGVKGSFSPGWSCVRLWPLADAPGWDLLGRVACSIRALACWF